MNDRKFGGLGWVMALLLASTGAVHAGVTLELTKTAGSYVGNPAYPGVVSGNSTALTNGATYTSQQQQPTGSGYIDSFVRVQGNPTMVQGYNTSNQPALFNNTSDDTFNHEITVGNAGFITQNGSTYMRFLLDINQNSGNGQPYPSSWLSLDEVQVFVSTNPNQSTTSFNKGILGLANSALVYSLDSYSTSGSKSVDRGIGLDFDTWKGGSGKGDMTLDITKGMFDAAFAKLNLTTAAQQNSAYVYLYSRFGDTYVNNDGYEEWTYVRGSKIGDGPCTDPNGCGGGGTGGVPEPGSLALVAFALLGAANARRRVAV